MEVRITHCDTPYIDRLLEHYLQAGVIEQKWIPQIKAKVAETGQALIPWRDGVKFDGPEFSVQFVKDDGTKIKVFPVSLTPWARWIKIGTTTSGPLKGLVMFMPEAFFETHGEDGLPLDH
jgi:hypothetical protein